MTALTSVQVVGAFTDAFNAGGPNTSIRFLSENVEMHAAPGWPGKQLYAGHSGARELAAEWVENFEEYRWAPERFEEAPDGAVVMLFRHSGRTRDGVPVDAPLGGVFEVTDGLIRKVRFFFSWEEALAAAGIEEEEG